MHILAMTCIRNEGPYLLDWAAHHFALGVDHLLIASHDCDDGTDRMADALAASGLASHLPFRPEPGKAVQWQALDVLRRDPRYTAADWALFLDVDEYVNPAAPATGLADMLAALPRDTDAVPLVWRLFGNSGAIDWEDGPVTRRFTRCAPADIALPAARFFKTLYRPAAFRKPGVHRPKSRDGDHARWCLPSGTALPDAFAANDKRINLFGANAVETGGVLNHYSVRSVDEFVLKCDRGLPNRQSKTLGLGYWAERNFNSREDLSIARFADVAQARRSELAAIDGLAALHQEATAWHRARLAQLLAHSETVRLHWHLQLMGDSRPPTVPALNRHLARLRAASP